MLEGSLDIEGNTARFIEREWKVVQRLQTQFLVTNFFLFLYDNTNGPHDCLPGRSGLSDSGCASSGAIGSQALGS
jgi:hypothetical protein